MDETLSYITTAGYFSADFNYPSWAIQLNDLFWIEASDGVGLYIVTAVGSSPTVGSPSSFALGANPIPQQISGTFSLSFTGPWANPATFTASYVKQGAFVAISMLNVSAACTSATYATSGAGAVPTNLRPLQNFTSPFVVTNNSANAAGLIAVNIDGTILINPLSGGYTASGNAGWDEANIPVYISTNV